MLLKEKEVCSSNQKSHKDCYESLGLYMKQINENYSDAIREGWLCDIKNKLPSQRYTVWVQLQRINTFRAEHNEPVELRDIAIELTENGGCGHAISLRSYFKILTGKSLNFNCHKKRQKRRLLFLCLLK